MSISSMTLTRYRVPLMGIAAYKISKISFRELMSYILPVCGDIATYFKYDGSVDDFVDIVDAWAEMICYAYNENREFGLKFVEFFESIILGNKSPILFPLGDKILDDILKKYSL